MLRTVSMFPQPNDGALVCDLDHNDEWPQYVNIELARWMVLEMGDPQAGPAITMLTKRPGSIPGLTDDLIEDKSQLAHFHRSDVFRIAIGEDSHQVNHAGVFLNPGDFFVMRASKRYTETLGLGNVRFVDLYADRRGIPATMADNKKHPAYDEKGMHEIVGQLFSSPPPFHTSDEQAVTGVATSFAPIPSGGRLHASMTNHDAWHTLADGSAVAVATVGDPVSGPLVIVSYTAPGTVEPCATWQADVFRLVVGGSCSVGGVPLRARQFRAVEAGRPEGDAVHGSDGSAQVLIVADRRSWPPRLDSSSARLHEISAVVDTALAAVPA